MRRLLLLVHLYGGLFFSTALLLFSIVGVEANLRALLPERPAPEAVRRGIDYRPPSGLADEEVADDLRRHLGLELAHPVERRHVRRRRGGDLLVRYNTPGSVFEAVLSERAGRVELAEQPHDLWRYLMNMHELALSGTPRSWKTVIWSLYLEGALLALIVLPVSGVALWLAGRRRQLWAAVLLAGSCVLFVVLYVLSRGLHG